MAIHVKTIKQFFLVIIILLIVKLVVTFKSVDEILNGKAFCRTSRACYFLICCTRWFKSLRLWISMKSVTEHAALYSGAVYDAIEDDSTFHSGHEIRSCDHSNFSYYKQHFSCCRYCTKRIRRNLSFEIGSRRYLTYSFRTSIFHFGEKVEGKCGKFYLAYLRALKALQRFILKDNAKLLVIIVI